MTVYGVGQSLNHFLTDMGNHAPQWVTFYAFLGMLIFLASVVRLIHKQIKGRAILYGVVILSACIFFNPLWFLPYGEFYQTVLLLLMVPLVLAELRWKKMFTLGDFALFNVPLWHWCVVYWIGCINEA